jgi:hypothetical protein
VAPGRNPKNHKSAKIKADAQPRSVTQQNAKHKIKIKFLLSSTACRQPVSHPRYLLDVLAGPTATAAHKNKERIRISLSLRR